MILHVIDFFGTEPTGRHVFDSIKGIFCLLCFNQFVFYVLINLQKRLNVLYLFGFGKKKKFKLI